MQERWKREAGDGREREVEVEQEQEVSGCVRSPRTVKSGSIDGVYLSWGAQGEVWRRCRLPKWS